MTDTKTGAASELHIANEWADMAVQWLRNIRDGISTPEAALADMEANAERIRALRATPPAPVTEGAQREAVAWRYRDKKEGNGWQYMADKPDFRHPSSEWYEIEPLYTAPPPPDRVQPERVEAKPIGYVLGNVFSLKEAADRARKPGYRKHECVTCGQVKSYLICMDCLEKDTYKHPAATATVIGEFKPGYRQPTYDDAVLALEEFADNEIEAVAAMLAALQHIGAVIPDAEK